MRVTAQTLGLPEEQLPRVDAIEVIGEPRRPRSNFTNDLGRPSIRFRCA